jgi:ABC-type Zn uptake system ZnuABC Zn-binding protein ZnuA
MIKRILLLNLCIAVILTACTNIAPASGKPRVVATTTVIGDITHNIAGDKIELTTLLKPGVDPHDYEPVPSDLQAISQARIVFANGAGLERWLDKLVQSAETSGKVVNVSDGLTLRTLDEAGVTVSDPHLWFDVNNAIHYAEQIRDGLISIDPNNAAVYQSNAQAYIAQLQDLDKWVVDQVNTLPAANRVLVTNHDTFGYFSQRYGFTILGTIFPTTGAEASPSAQQIAQLVTAIKQAKVKAVFTENTLNPDLAQTIAQEAGVQVIDQLYTDSLGPIGSPASTYIDMLHFDVQTLVNALK